MQTILILRVSMGTLLIVAGSMKFVEPREAKAAIFAFRLVPYRAVTAIYVGLISAELAAGVLLLTGFMVSIGAYVSAALFLTFGVAILSVIGRGIVAPCGCFGNSVDEKASWTTMARAFTLAAAALTLAIMEGHAFRGSRDVVAAVIAGVAIAVTLRLVSLIPTAWSFLREETVVAPARGNRVSLRSLPVFAELGDLAGQDGSE